MEARGGDGAEQLSASAMPAERPRISLHNFHGRLAEQLVHFHAMRLKDSLFLWIGDAPHLGSLAVAMCTPRDSIPASTLLTGDASDTTSISLAQRLDGNNPLKVKAFEGTFQHDCNSPSLGAPQTSSSKTKKQIFVSYNIQNKDSSFILLVENRIKEEMTTSPEKF